MSRRTRVAPLVVAVVIGVTALTAPATGAVRAGSAGACPTLDEGVTVVVDRGPGNGGVEVRCAPGAPTSGLAALQSAGFSYGFVPQVPGMVCVIDDQPDGCNGAPSDAYWSYWFGARGGPWTYSTLGAGARRPSVGSVEGWAFGDGGEPSVAPPAPPAPAPTPPPPPGPAPSPPPPAPAPPPGPAVPAPAPAPAPGGVPPSSTIAPSSTVTSTAASPTTVAAGAVTTTAPLSTTSSSTTTAVAATAAPTTDVPGDGTVPPTDSDGGDPSGGGAAAVVLPLGLIGGLAAAATVLGRRRRSIPPPEEP